VEVNASDTRSKADVKSGTGIAGKLSNIVKEMVTSTSIAGSSGAKRRQVGSTQSTNLAMQFHIVCFQRRGKEVGTALFKYTVPFGLFM
jgi:hypothetical protein